MNLLIFLAKRMLKRNEGSFGSSSSKYLSVGSIALGVAIVLIALTILDGFDNAITDKIVKMNSHIKITAFGKRNLVNSDEFISQLKNDFGSKIISISPFVQKEVLVKSKKFSDGVTLHGITKEKAEQMKDNFTISKHSSSLFDNKYGIFIGKKLAERLFVKIGDKLTVFGLKNNEPPSELNPPIIEQFVVNGIFESGISEYDDLNVYIALPVAREMFSMENSASGYDINVSNTSLIREITRELKNKLHYPYYVRSIFKVHQNIFTWLELQKEPIPLILGIIVFVAIFNIVGALLMSVLEKVYNFGVLRSLGMRKKIINRIVLLQGLYLSFWGILIGDLIAFTLSVIQKYFNVIPLPGNVYFLSNVPITISFDNYLLVSAAALSLGIVAAIIPARFASRISPLMSIRFK